MEIRWLLKINAGSLGAKWWLIRGKWGPHDLELSGGSLGGHSASLIRGK